MPIYITDPNIDPECRKAADRYLAACNNLDDQTGWSVKAFTALNIFYWQIEAFDRHADPRPEFIKKFNQATELLKNACNFSVGTFPPTDNIADENDFEDRIAGLFSDVWVGFKDDIYFDQSYDFLVERFRRNDVDRCGVL
jgi:hypothetical protein